MFDSDVQKSDCDAVDVTEGSTAYKAFVVVGRYIIVAMASLKLLLEVNYGDQIHREYTLGSLLHNGSVKRVI